MAQETRNDSRRAREVMTRDPECVSERDSLRDAASIMKRADTGVVPVIDGGRKIIGLVTDRDIVVRCVADGKNPMEATVRDVMTKNVRTVRDDSTVGEVIDLMSKAQIRRVPVVNKNDEVVGIISVRDLAERSSSDRVGEAVKEISEGPANN